MDIVNKLARELGIGPKQAAETVKLIDEGNTIPFIARYRKEMTGGLSDVTLRELDERLSYLRNLEDKKEEVLRLIEEQGKLTDELASEIRKADKLQRIEDLYRPYRHKKATRASKAKERGLGPLADIILSQPSKNGDESEESALAEIALPFVTPGNVCVPDDKCVSQIDDAIGGACDIIAEMISDDPDMTEYIRKLTFEKGMIETEAVNPEEKTVYDKYYGASERISRIPDHRVLAVSRGEKEKKLRVRIEAPEEEILEYIESRVIRNRGSFVVTILKETAADSYKRLTAPSVEREIRRMLFERAEGEAVKIFAKNTEKLLMVPPVKGARVIAIDPGFRTGCKVAVLNETGKLLSYTTIYPTEPRKDIKGTFAVLSELIEKYRINTIVIGNGTATRETEEVVADFIRKTGYDVKYTIVNEAGASVYSASELATKEYPELDVTTRGAMSLGRRLQDPLAELVKISPQHIGVGQYQHDVDRKHLEDALKAVVEDCVNRVGVDLNTASPSLLSYIAGINMTIAGNIVAYREENGSFTSRKQLMKVPRLGQKTYEQCAGFMRITGGSEPLDATAVHPESYRAAAGLLKLAGVERSELSKGGIADIEEKIKEKCGSVSSLAQKLGIGKETLKDIIEEIRKPARDPREDAPPVVFRNDVRKIEDLRPGMEMNGTVRNVVDFGAFVDIGLKNDGLVHISQLSDRYVKHPLDIVSVGDTVKVRILDIDSEKGRISLSMKGIEN